MFYQVPHNKITRFPDSLFSHYKEDFACKAGHADCLEGGRLLPVASTPNNYSGYLPRAIRFVPKLVCSSCTCYKDVIQLNFW